MNAGFPLCGLAGLALPGGGEEPPHGADDGEGDPNPLGLGLEEPLGNVVGIGNVGVGDACRPPFAPCDGNALGEPLGEPLGVGSTDADGLGDGDGQLGLDDGEADGSVIEGDGEAPVDGEFRAAARVAPPATTSAINAIEVRNLLMAFHLSRLTRKGRSLAVYPRLLR